MSTLRNALISLAGNYGGRLCWCDMRIGNPSVREHSEECEEAYSALSRPIMDSLDEADLWSQLDEWYWDNWSYSGLIGYHLRHSDDSAFRSMKQILYPNGGGDVS